jgi:hypothetical protein
VHFTGLTHQIFVRVVKKEDLPFKREWKSEAPVKTEWQLPSYLGFLKRQFHTVTQFLLMSKNVHTVNKVAENLNIMKYCKIAYINYGWSILTREAMYV